MARGAHLSTNTLCLPFPAPTARTPRFFSVSRRPRRSPAWHHLSPLATHPRCLLAGAMFDFSWSEMAVIAGVALVLIGPKDMPVAIRTITGMIKKARRMAGEFQTHVHEMMREAELDDVKNTLNEIRNFDLKGEMERAVDPDGSLRDTFAKNLLDPASPVPADDTTSQTEATGVAEPPPEPALDAPLAAPAPVCTRPAFMPPGAVP